MKLSHFFIDRPIFAAVLSTFIFIAGAIALTQLPISEYPEVVPPSVVVRATYPGANPKVIASTVAAPLEQAIVGVEDMLYMSSTSTMDGSLTLTVTFRVGTDVDRAQMLVQNRVQQALPRLPEEVRDLGVTTTKSSPNLTMVVHLYSPDGRYDTLYLRNYAVLQHPRRAGAPPGHGRRAAVRRRRLCHAHLARSRRSSPRAISTAGDVVDCHPRAERPGGGRPDRRAARCRAPISSSPSMRWVA